MPVIDACLFVAAQDPADHRGIKPPGLFALYVTGYSAFRIFEESLRVDPSEHFLGLRLNMYVAIVLAVGGALWFWRTQRRDRPVPATADGPADAEEPQASAPGEGAGDTSDGEPGSGQEMPAEVGADRGAAAPEAPAAADGAEHAG